MRKKTVVETNSPVTTMPKLVLMFVRILTVASVVVGLLCLLATALSLLARLYWFLDLFTSFALQYAIALSACMLVVALGRVYYRLATCFLIAALWNGFQVFSVFVPISPPSQPLTEPVRIVVSNVLSENRRYEAAWKTWQDADPDVLVLLEFDSRWQATSKVATDDYPYRYEFPSNDNFGIACYSKLPVKNAHKHELGEWAIGAVHLEVEIEATTLNIVAAHPVPPVRSDYSEQRQQYLEQLSSLVGSMERVVVVGDLNLTPYSPHFGDFIKSSGLHDSRRGFGIQGTWPVEQWLLRIPIDHCLISTEIPVVDRRVMDSVGSDHFPLQIDVQAERPE